MTSSLPILSVNWHLTGACNYSCRFCFAKNIGDTPVRVEEGKKIIRRLAENGIQKINFVGGEPLLHPYLNEYCIFSKDCGMTVSVTTNGSLLNGSRIFEMAESVDWLALSVDSSSDEVERVLGRGYGNHVSHCIDIVDKIHEAGISLKVNTTVTALTWHENMRPIIRLLNPRRWKVFQMLHIQGENDDAVSDLGVSDEQFMHFRKVHQQVVLETGDNPIFESCDDMESSYFMINPAGNVIINKGRFITEFSLDEVLERGIENFVSPKKYHQRGGYYDWSSHFTQRRNYE